MVVGTDWTGLSQTGWIEQKPMIGDASASGLSVNGNSPIEKTAAK